MAQEFLTRKQLVAYLTDIGLPTSKSHLDKLSMKGEGPPTAGRWGRCDIYKPDTVRDWALKKHLQPSPSARRED
jgi:hypothetical protein